MPAKKPTPEQLKRWEEYGADTARRGYNSTWSPREVAAGSPEWEAWHDGHANYLKSRRDLLRAEAEAGRASIAARDAKPATPRLYQLPGLNVEMVDTCWGLTVADSDNSDVFAVIDPDGIMPGLNIDPQQAAEALHRAAISHEPLLSQLKAALRYIEVLNAFSKFSLFERVSAKAIEDTIQANTARRLSLSGGRETLATFDLEACKHTIAAAEGAK